MSHSYLLPNPRTTLYNQIATMGSTLSRVWSSGSKSTLSARPGPSSPRRRRYQSSGRGGAGNIRPLPPDLGERTQTSTCISDGLDNVPLTQGSERHLRPYQVISTGRGGRGNMRLRRGEDTHSRSQPLAEAEVVEYERLVRSVTRDVRQQTSQSSGRGGAGNATFPIVDPYPTAAVIVSVSVVTL